MRFLTLGHVGAAAAVIAGLVRALLIVVPLGTLSPAVRESLYLGVDFAILLALFGIAAHRGNKPGPCTVLGLIMAGAGVLVIRTGERSLFGAAAYPTGSALLAIGLAVTSIPLLGLRGSGRIAAILLIASPVIAIIGSISGLAAVGSTLATALFSAGLIAIGLTLARAAR